MATIQTQLPFKVGDSVILKSSAKPVMTVLIVYDEKVNCTYYNTITGKFDKQDFPLATIRKYTSPST